MKRTGADHKPVGEIDAVRVARQREVDRQTRENLKPLVSPEGRDPRPIEPDAKSDASGRRDVASGPSAAVEVGNFEKSRLVSDGDVRQVLGGRLPESHVQGLGRISYVDEHRPEPGGVLLGQYAPGSRQIEVFRQTPEGSSDREKMEHTLVHEAAHHVYHTRISDADRGTWDDLSRGSGRTEYVSDYAKVSTREDFAESYWSYVRNPEALADTCPAKHAYMESLWKRS